MPAVAKKRVSRPLVEKPRLLVFKEKHEDRYFHVTNDEELFRVALYVLTQRFNEGYWYNEPDESEKPVPPDVTEEDIAKLPKSLQETALQKLRAYKRELREWEQVVADYQLIERAVEREDGRAAWEALQSRSDAEYEGFRLVAYDEVEDE